MAIAERELVGEQVVDTSSVRRQITMQIRQELGIDQLLDKMLAFPAELRRHQEAAAAARRAVEEARGELQLQESILVAEITSATDPKTGKALFSNDAARRAELEKRKSTSADYQAAAKKLADAEEALRSAELEVEQLKNEFSAIRHAVDMQREVFAALTR